METDEKFQFDLQLFADGADASGSGENGGGANSGAAGDAQGDPATKPGAGDASQNAPKGDEIDPALVVDESKLDPHVKLIINDYKRNLKEAQKNASAAQKIADDAKKAADAAIAAANDAKKKLTAKEEAELAEQKKWQELAEKRADEKKIAEEAAEKRFTDQETKHRAELDEYNNGLILEAVARAAEREGIFDPEDVEHPVFAEALKLATVKNGRVTGAKEVAEKMREIKPGKFKVAEEGGGSGGGQGGQQQGQQGGGERDAQGRFIPPAASKKTGVKDFSNATKQEMDDIEARLRRGVA